MFDLQRLRKILSAAAPNYGCKIFIVRAPWIILWTGVECSSWPFPSHKVIVDLPDLDIGMGTEGIGVSLNAFA